MADPPGVTGNEHDPRCPQHRDYTKEHECADLPRYGVTIESWYKSWRLVARHAFDRAYAKGIRFCPYCAVELPGFGCCCAEIQAGTPPLIQE